MCGIIAYIGKNNSIPFLIEGLKKLEYRGYDSAGICIKDKKGLNLIKKQGRVKELEKSAKLTGIKGTIGIAHTRWGTHGAPSAKNAHPHFDCKKNIAVVHNGIIENYQAIKELLKKENHIFSSQTDSEVIAHLIEKFYHNNDLEGAVFKALSLLKGAFGLAVICKDEEKIIAARKGSPLILGVGKEETFVASDAPAILNYTKRVVYFNDNELAVISKEGYIVKNLKGEKIDKKIFEIKWTVDQIEKGGFKHFMLKEIFQQPEAIENALRGRINKGKIKLNLNFNPKSVKRIIITSCGTSWHSGLIGKYLIENFAKIPVEVDYASEFRYRDPIIKKGDLLIVISQSGETADTLHALKEGKEKKAKTLGIINVVGSTISREVDSGIYLHAGPEIGVASTKAFSSQVVILFILALFLRQERGLKINKKIFNELKSIPEKIREILKESKKIREIAKKFKNSSNFLYLGRGINFPVALEGALKLKEISYIHAEGYPAAEMKHGPIALIDKNMPTVFISPKDLTFDKIISNMEEVKARGGRILAVINKEDKKLLGLIEKTIKIPKCLDELTPLLNVVPLQLLAYHIADLKNIDVDKPRNLAKSVTVE